MIRDKFSFCLCHYLTVVTNFFKKWLQGQSSDRVSVDGLLCDLAAILPKSYGAQDLHLVQGLPRDVSGTLVVAKYVCVTMCVCVYEKKIEMCVCRCVCV